MKNNKQGFWLGFSAWLVIIAFTMAMAVLFGLAVYMVISLIGTL